MRTLTKWVAIGWSAYCLIGVLVGLETVRQDTAARAEAGEFVVSVVTCLGMAAWTMIWAAVAGPAALIYMMTEKKRRRSPGNVYWESE